MRTIDLNCDLGEGCANDAELMRLISSANIACGFHAGDDRTMARTVDLAIENGVAIGAHPGYDDKENFGRTAMALAFSEIRDIVAEQILALRNICVAKGVSVSHIKPHGALYNQAAKDRNIAAAIAEAVVTVDPDLIFFGLSGSVMIDEAAKAGLTTACEVFADRSYQSDGTLTPRPMPNALITDEDASLTQVMDMVKYGWVRSVDAIMVAINAETLCIHGDGEHAVNFAANINRALERFVHLDKASDTMKERSLRSVILGAAFLMATSAVGPGFLTQTTVFTKQLLASFGFVILLSVVLDIFAQLNIWRVLTVSGKRGQDVANETIPGSGYLLAALIVFGGIAFNIGNIAGAGLGLNVLFGIPVEMGAAISAAIGIGIFLVKDAGKAMDLFVKVLGVVMLILIVYVVFRSQPPVGEAMMRTFAPLEIDARAIVTLVGGTVGGYITFAGAHRLIDAGISGVGSLKEVNRSAVTGIVLTACIRFLLFLAALGVVSLGMALDESNPAASVFQNAAGTVGYKIFGIVIWSAAITSVIGAAFTSVSFFKTFHPSIEAKSRYVVVIFIVFSTAVFLLIGRPVVVLVWAGTINGFILPIGLAIVLLASRKAKVVGEYTHPLWLQIAGWAVVLIMAGFDAASLV